jgi:hypothetical protein
MTARIERVASRPDKNLKGVFHMKRKTVILLFTLMVISPVFAPAATQIEKDSSSNQTTDSMSKPLPVKRMTSRQKRALRNYDSSVSIEFDEQLVPSSIRGHLSDRIHSGDPEAEAKAALALHGAALRVGPDDAFVINRIRKDKAGVEHVIMTQTYKGIPVTDGVIVVHLSESAVIGISGRFVADLDLSTEPQISKEQAVASALSEMEHAENDGKADALATVILIDKQNMGRLAIPVRVDIKEGTENRSQDIFIDAGSGRALAKRESPARNPEGGMVPAHFFVELLQDPGFESGTNCTNARVPCSGWSGTPGVLGNNNLPHSGLRNAWLCGYGVSHTDTLSQTVSIPAAAGSATLSFYLDIYTDELTHSFPYDKLTISVYKVNEFGGVSLLKVLATCSNLNAAPYQFQSFDLTPYRGNKIKIMFTGQEDGSLQTSFNIDDTSLTVFID